MGDNVGPTGSFFSRAIFDAGSAQVGAQRYVRDVEADSRNDFTPAVDGLRRRGSLTTAHRGAIDNGQTS
jgi:hypothetical protein